MFERVLSARLQSKSEQMCKNFVHKYWRNLFGRVTREAYFKRTWKISGFNDNGAEIISLIVQWDMS